MSEVRDRIDLGIWGFLRSGWWILHVVAIIVVAYIGYWVGRI